MSIDQRIAAELRRHAPEVDEHAAWDRIRSRAPVQRRTRVVGLVVVPVAAAGLLIMGSILFSTLSEGPEPAGPSESPVLGKWVAQDVDGSTMKATIEVSAGGVVEMVVADDFASVCSGASSTMIGTGGFEGDNVVVFTSPVLTCDDGSRPQVLSGPPLGEQLRDLTFTHDPGNDTLTDSLGSVWAREGAAEPEPVAETPLLWPQTSLEEVREAQRLADAGDPDYTWQVDPDLGWLGSYEQERPVFESSEILVRFLREELGWENFRYWPGGHGSLSFNYLGDNAFVRCASDGINPLYPDDELGGECAPTIDQSHYEWVSIDLVRFHSTSLTFRSPEDDPSGIWVVSAWRTLSPYEQMTPPSEAETAAVVGDFLQARIEGEGAESYIDVPVENDAGEIVWQESETGDIPLLYATTTGARYERAEFEIISGPKWPEGEMQLRVRLFAEDGSAMVEQLFVMNVEQGQLGLQYCSIHPQGLCPFGTALTTENGQPVAEMPQQYEFLNGEVTFGADSSWDYSWAGWEFSPTTTTLLLDQNHETRLVILADPAPIETGCLKSPTPADVETLAESLQSDGALETTAPMTVALAGMEALQVDVVSVTTANLCEEVGVPEVVAGGTATGLEPGERMRLYLFDLPDGLSARILAVAVVAPEERFESVLEQAAPILDSVQFHAR